MKSLIDLFHQYKSHPSQTTLIPLLESYQAMIYAVCFQVLEQGQDAEDAAQEVLIEIVEGIGRISDPLHFKRWVCRVAYNNALDLRRKRIRQAQHLERFAQEKDKEAQMQSSVHFKEIQEVIHEHIAQLDNDSRMLIVEHHFEKRTLEEIAKERGVSTSAIWQKIQKTHEALKRSMAEAGYAGLNVAIVPFLESIEPATISHNLITPAILGKATAATVSSAAASTLTIGGILMTTKTIIAIAVIGILGTGILAYEFFREPKNHQEVLTSQIQPIKRDKNIGGPKPVKTKTIAATKAPSVFSARAQEIADQIRQADEKVDAETMTKWINELVALGPDAIPVIEDLLLSHKNIRYHEYVTPLQTYDIYPTLRVGLLNALRQIGAPIGNSRTKEVALSVLSETQNYHEIFEISQIIMQSEKSIAPYRNDLLAAIKRELNRHKEQIVKSVEERLKIRAEIDELLQPYRDKSEERPNEITDIVRAKEAILHTKPDSEWLGLHGFEYGMIFHLGGAEELKDEIVELCSYSQDTAGDLAGLRLLATTLEPEMALETLRKAYEIEKTHKANSKLESSMASFSALKTMGYIYSAEFHEYALQLYSQLDDAYERKALIDGIKDGGLNPVMWENPFVKSFDYSKRAPTHSVREPTLEMARVKLDLLYQLKQTVSVGYEQRHLESAIKELEKRIKWMEKAQRPRE